MGRRPRCGRGSRARRGAVGARLADADDERVQNARVESRVVRGLERRNCGHSEARSLLSGRARGDGALLHPSGCDELLAAAPSQLSRPHWLSWKEETKTRAHSLRKTSHGAPHELVRQWSLSLACRRGWYTHRPRQGRAAAALHLQHWRPPAGDFAAFRTARVAAVVRPCVSARHWGPVSHIAATALRLVPFSREAGNGQRNTRVMEELSPCSS